MEKEKMNKEFTIRFRANEETVFKLDVICDKYNFSRSEVLRRLIDVGINNEFVDIAFTEELAREFRENFIENRDLVIDEKYIIREEDDGEVIIKDIED